VLLEVPDDVLGAGVGEAAWAPRVPARTTPATRPAAAKLALVSRALRFTGVSSGEREPVEVPVL